MLTSFKKIFKFGWENFSRNKGLFFATIFITVITSSLISGLFILNGATEHLIASIQEKVDISVYFSSYATEEEIFDIEEKLAKIPEVKDIEYISKEEALYLFKERHKNNPVIIESLEEIGENPLAAHLNIKAWEASQYEQISGFLEGGPFNGVIDKVDYYQNKTIIDRIFSITSTIERASLFFIAVSSILAVLITFNTVRLGIMNFKEEISVMRLVGASNWFIRGPFAVQGFISGIIATIVTVIIFSVGCWFLSPKIGNVVSEFNLFSYFQANIFAIIGIQLGTSLLLGIIPSLIAIRKYLKV